MKSDALATPKPVGKFRLVSITDAAAYLDFNTKTVRALIARGTLHGYRLPGSKLIRVDLNQLDALIAAGTVA